MSKTNALSQKEYLQKYLSGPKKDPKKKKKRQKVIGNGMKIIDDDLDLTKMRSLDENEIDLFMQNEDAPQVVGIVDERSDEIKTLENFKQINKWKLMSQDDGVDSAIKIEQITTKKSNADDSDLSPPRNKNDSDLSPDRNTAQRGRSPDLSPPRKKKLISKRLHKSNNKNSDSDLSPPRRSNNKGQNHNSDSDLSPPRKINKHHSKRSDSSNHEKFDRENKRDNRYEHERHSRDDRIRSERRSDRSNRSDVKRRSRWGSESNDRDTSENRGNDHRGSKMDKTLDGKRAGLQNALELKNENDDFKKRENEMFSKLSEDLTGRNATAIKRDIRGRKKDTEAELAAQKEREERQKVLEAKYSRWGKGLKQTEEQEMRIQEFIHESSKPLARYKDDQDLDQQLRKVERLEDPMLEYMRKKTKDKHTEGNREVFPIYKGPYPINRFNIRPGYRWDGVDRSNGYEKRYFDNKSAKVANEEESYKWSTEDM